MAATDGKTLWLYGGNVYVDALNQPRTSEFWKLDIATGYWSLKTNNSLWYLFKYSYYFNTN
jgi:hypothetical protein